MRLPLYIEYWLLSFFIENKWYNDGPSAFCFVFQVFKVGGSELYVERELMKIAVFVLVGKNRYLLNCQVKIQKLPWSCASLNIVTWDERSSLITMIESILSKQRDTLGSVPRHNVD